LTTTSSTLSLEEDLNGTPAGGTCAVPIGWFVLDDSRERSLRRMKRSHAIAPMTYYNATEL
jgi:hypothetical protein